MSVEGHYAQCQCADCRPRTYAGPIAHELSERMPVILDDYESGMSERWVEPLIKAINILSANNEVLRNEIMLLRKEAKLAHRDVKTAEVHVSMKKAGKGKV
jgi:hypothetical protein